MRNILVVVGSARKRGNTDRLADAFIEGAREAGHTVHKVFLGETQVNGCLGCNACRYGKPCVQRDGMEEIYPLFQECDTIVLASPLYYWTISARLKAFLERLYAVSQPDPNPPLGRYEKYPHKDCVLMMTAADDFFWTFEQAVSYFRFSLIRYLGWTEKGMLLAGGCGGSGGPRKIEHTGYLEQARAMGQNL